MRSILLFYFVNMLCLERFSWTATDANNLAAAREWSRTQFVPQAAESLSKSYLRRIDQIPLPDKRFDIVVRVMHVAQQDSAGHVTVVVWDGTDMPAIAFHSSGQLGLQPPSARVRRASDLPDLPPPQVGDMVELRVPVSERAVLDIVRALKAGDWVKVRNVHSVYDSERGLVHLQICADSALYAVPCDANIVLALLSHSEERVQGLCCTCYPSYPPKCDSLVRTGSWLREPPPHPRSRCFWCSSPPSFNSQIHVGGQGRSRKVPAARASWGCCAE